MNVEIVRVGGTSFAAWLDGASVIETAYHTGFGQWEVVDPGTGDCLHWADTRAEAFGFMVEFAMSAGNPHIDPLNYEDEVRDLFAAAREMGA